MYNSKLNAEYFNELSKGYFPEQLEIEITNVEEGLLHAEMKIKKKYFAPNGFLHAGSMVSFADTVAGYGALAHLPENGKSFTTLELKSNFIGAIKKGKLHCECVAEHLGRTTQIWRVILRDLDSSKNVAIFSCTQLILY